MEEKIRGFINENIMADDDIQLADTDNIFEKGIVGSLFSMKLITFLENEFGLTVNYEDMNLENFNSIANIVEYVKRKKGDANG